MKLTEKELNEFPIGTKIITENYMFIKTGYDLYAKRDVTDCFWENKEVITFEVKKVEIPTTWGEYIPPKPILDDKEKEYLSAVIRPFRDKIKSIAKHSYRAEEYVFLYAVEAGNGFGLPYFKKGTMYKGMELDREYSLEELRHINS